MSSKKKKNQQFRWRLPQGREGFATGAITGCTSGTRPGIEGYNLPPLVPTLI
jgi:hypothetical protein